MLLSFVRLLGRLWRTCHKPAPSRKPRRRASLQVEQLETRWVPAVISGYVFNDLNADGVYQAGEPGVTVGNQTGGQTVQLYDANGDLLGTTQTGSDGSYSFNVNPAIQSTPTQSYTFTDALTGMTQTSPPPQNGQQAISQFNSALGVLESVTITEHADITIDPTIQNLEPDSRTITAAVSGSINLTAGGQSVPSPTTLQANLPDYDPTGIDAAAHDYGPQDLTGTATETITDPNALQAFIGNGSVSLSEKANATLYWPDGQPANVNSGSTGSGGATVTITYNYAPATSQYKVVLVQNPPGYTAGPWSQTNTQELTTTTGQEAIGVTINNSSENANNNNFSFYQSASIKGTVYNDANNDGAQDNRETVINGTITPVTVTLQGPGGTQTTPLGADGTFSFNNLEPGTYSVSVSTPSGFIAGVANSAEVPPATTGSTQYSNITLNSGVQGSNFNFGVYQGGSLSGHVYQDTGTTPTPLSGISVTLINAVTGATVGTTTTDSNGVYSFTDLPVGAYTITKAAAVSPLADEKKIPGSLGVDTSRGTTPTADQFFVDLGTPASMENVGTGYDFYENEASIQGTVYNDANNDGSQDDRELAINGTTTPVTITLQGPGGTQTTQVAGDGTYSFSNLIPGTYSVQITTPNGYVAGIANSAESPHATATSTQYTGIVLGTGAQGTNFNFGIYQGDSLSGNVLLDAGGTTTGLSGITVTLTDAATGKVVATTTTDVNGAYQFNNLLIGNYTITKDPPAQGLSDEKKVPGNLGVDTSRGTTPTADQFFVDLGTAASNDNVGTDYDFYEDINVLPPPQNQVPPPPVVSKLMLVGGYW